MDWLAATESWWGRFALTRGIAAIYLVAFLCAALQFRGLLGSNGMTPIPKFLARSSFRAKPSIFHLHYSDRFFAAVCWAGAAVSAALVLGLGDAVPLWAAMLLWFGLWVGLSVHRQRRAVLVLLRLGVTAAGGRLPRGIPRQRRDRTRRCWCCCSPAGCCSVSSSAPG